MNKKESLQKLNQQIREQNSSKAKQAKPTAPRLDQEEAP